jgi:hypothetical protein
MDIQDRRKWAGGADRLDNPHLYIACACGNGDPLFIDIELWDRRGLNVVQNLPCTLGAEIVKEWGLRRRLRDLPGRVF